MRPSSGLSGGLDPPSAECPQPVHTNERDALRDKLGEVTAYYAMRPYGQHWHEGHPDLQAWLADLVPRVNGLVKRPKLLRCSAEARRKGGSWYATWKSTIARIKKHPQLDGIPSARGATVIPAGGFTIKSLNMRDYHVRSFGKWTDEYHRSGVESAKPKPKGSAVVGVPFDPLVGGAGGDPTKSGAGRVTALEQAAIDAGITPTATAAGDGGSGLPSLPPAAQGLVTSLTTGSVFGVPKTYLVYGGLGLIGYNMFFKKRRR